MAIVTGAGEGIGRGVARRFAVEGATVIVAEIKAETGERAADELSGLGGEGVFVPVDVSDKASVEGMVNKSIETYGRVDILVNNAYPTGGLPVRLENKNDDDFRKAMEAGFFGTLWAMRAVFEPMRKQGGGRIINMCSLNGVNAHMYTADYNTTKEAVRCLTRSAAREDHPLSGKAKKQRRNLLKGIARICPPKKRLKSRFCMVTCLSSLQRSR